MSDETTKQPPVAAKCKEQHQQPATPLTFPSSKIKAHVLRNDGVGRLSNKAVEYINACSAAFCQKLIQDSSSNKDGVLTLDMVQACVNANDQYDFLRQPLSSVEDDASPCVNQSSTKRKRTKPTNSKPPKRVKRENDNISKALAQVDGRQDKASLSNSASVIKDAIIEAQQEPLNRGGVVLDEDDYD